MQFSLIIPSRNRAKTLSRTLERTLAATLGDPRTEVIVVDNNSTDNTKQVVEGHQHRSAGLRYLHQEQPGLLAARHAGWKAAGGEILLFLDDDVFICDTIIDAYQDVFSSQDVWLAGGNNWPLFEGEIPSWLEEEWNRSIDGKQALPELSILKFPHKAPIEHDPFFVWGCNFAIRRTALQAAGGFHPDGYPGPLLKFRGDGETHVASFVKDNGGRTIFHPNASVHHLVSSDRMTVDYMRNRAFSNGITSSYTKLRKKYAGKPALYPFVDKFRYSVAQLFSFERDSERDDSGEPTEPSINCFRDFIRHHESRGKLFHKTAFYREAKVMEWTLRSNYLGGEAPSA